MSQYGREWDQGKDWNAGGYRGNVRGRDDEEDYGESKRRKHHGGYEENAQWNSGHDTSAYGYGGSSAQYDQDYSADDRQQRGFQGRKRHVASEPSPHVIFLGLDSDFTESDLFGFIKGYGFELETVTIIRDRNSGQSKGFGFAQFKSTEEAQQFVDPHFPFISVPPPASHGASAMTAFRKALETSAPHNGRRVKIDYSQSANPPDRGRGKGPMFQNDGTRDIGNSQAAVLLFRGLEPLAGPAAIAQAMKGSLGYGREGGKGMKRILLIKDKVTMASWGFAFVEFVDVSSASAVLAATMSIQLHPNGFRIADKPVAASFAHPYSFQPVPDHTIRDETCVRSSIHLGGVEDVWIKYWDEGSTLAVMEFKVEEADPVPEIPQPGKEKKEKKKKISKPGEPLADPKASELVSTKPVAFNFKLSGQSKSNTAANAKSALGFVSLDDPNAPNNEDESGNMVATSEETKAKAASKVPPLIASKKTVNNITKWSQVQEELKQNVAFTSVPQVPASAPLPADSDFEYSDTKALICLLCSRQLKSLDQLKRHNKESDLHKVNLKDSALCDVAREKLAKQRDSSQSEPSTRYRDRASERRVLHNQPETPMPEGIKTSSHRQAEGPPPPPSPPPAPVAPAKDENNVGNKLLKLMGWTEGTGLGTDGEGRVEPIQTAIYATGVGLGASKAKEIGKYADGYAGYVHMAKDAARERYAE